MRSGVSFPSYASTAVWTAVTGSWDASFPVTNLASLQRLRRIAKASDAAARAFTFVLPASQSIGFMALAHHNAGLGATARIRLFSGTNPDPVAAAGAIVYDSAVTPIFPTGAAPTSVYPQTWPHRLAAPVTARSGRIDLSANLNAWKIGAVEISGFWEWKDVAVPRTFGVTSGDFVSELSDSVNQVMSGWSPRAVTGSRASMTQAETETTALDFHRDTGLDKPFIWVWDADDPTTWARQVFVVTNTSLPAPIGLSYPKGEFSFAFGEYLR